MIFLRSTFWSLLVFAFTLNVSAQKNVKVHYADSIGLALIQNPLPEKAKSIKKIDQRLERYVEDQRSAGYLTFSIDSITETDDSIHIYIFAGKQYPIDAISVSDETSKQIGSANASRYIKNGKLSLNDYSAFSRKVVRYYENSGFPFAKVYLDNIRIENERIAADIQIDKGSFVTFDSLIMKGDVKLASSYIYPYLGLRRKKPYNENVIRQIPAKISELPFVSEVRPSGIEFVEDKAHLYLFLNKVKTNQFDGYIGLVPVDERSGKVALSGELNLKLNNVFTIGESISLLWRSPERYSQYLNINAHFPYLLWTPFGVGFDFTLDKSDTSYLNINYVIALQYSFRGNNHIKIYYDHITSNILNTELLVVDINDPSYADYRKSLYGVEITFRKLDYLYNPRKGFLIVLNGSAGNRNIVKNSKAEESLYDNMEMSSARYRIIGNIRGYIPMHPRWVLVLDAKGGGIFGSHLTLNELFKIGGVLTLRGFDENSIVSSSYLIGTGELRFIFARKSFINAFFNGGWYERDTSEHLITDTPFGFGIGVAFDTKAGMFSLSYALGKQFDNPITFKSGKIHFGILLSF